MSEKDFHTEFMTSNWWCHRSLMLIWSNTEITQSRNKEMSFLIGVTWDTGRGRVLVLTEWHSHALLTLSFPVLQHGMSVFLQRLLDGRSVSDDGAEPSLGLGQGDPVYAHLGWWAIVVWEKKEYFSLYVQTMSLRDCDSNLQQTVPEYLTSLGQWHTQPSYLYSVSSQLPSNEGVLHLQPCIPSLQVFEKI